MLQEVPASAVEVTTHSPYRHKLNEIKENPEIWGKWQNVAEKATRAAGSTKVSELRRKFGEEGFMFNLFQSPGGIYIVGAKYK